MDKSQLLSKIESGEGQHTEFKTSFAEQDEAIRSLCAFTQAEGGSVFFGVNDDGDIVGVTIGKNTIENFTTRLRSSTQPPLNPTIEQFDVEGKTIGVVSIGKGDEGTLYYASNVPYIRIGKTNQVLGSVDVKERLYKTFQAENLARKTDIPFQKITPIKIRRIKQNIPDYLIRLTNGREILNMVTGCDAGSLQNDELTTQEEVDLVGSFFQSIQGWCDLGIDADPSTRVRFEFDLTQAVKDLEEAGFFVFGAREIQRIEGGVGGSAPFPVSIIQVMRQTNPDIISIPRENK
ncbi:MAG: ATP-binding protein [Dehalococcoidia bacterium]